MALQGSQTCRNRNGANLCRAEHPSCFERIYKWRQQQRGCIGDCLRCSETFSEQGGTRGKNRERIFMRGEDVALVGAQSHDADAFQR
jgi:hypothetical protein